MTEAAPFRAGFVAIVGRPNAGKSTLLNALLETKLSIVSPKPQTTRHKILGILDGPGYQACFLDTPGWITKPADALQASLRKASKTAAHEDPDLLLLVVEPQPPAPAALEEIAALTRGPAPLLLVLNKADLAPDAARLLDAWTEALKPAAALAVSALKGDGIPRLREELVARLPESPPFYEPGQLSDRWERFFAAEIIREQVFELYREEIPHATAVQIEEFKEGKPDQVRATLFVERDGQKGIILGKQGKALRELVEASRKALREFLGRPVELDLWVKVRPNWRKDPEAVRELGY